ncbi:GerW family sporulation protein [Eubacterium sp. ER2]|uniref:GerW family sporulation protein n=1 Tax=Eubacterium sp. ER2 TaxID=1519438 RepID=UPI00051C91EE|nr:GerW family sporulation protein [Eubacterium sp. ER2]
MADNNFKGTVEALFHGMDAVISSRTVVGDAIHINDTIILPLVDVSFAVGAGAFNGDKSGEKKEKGAGGLGGRMTPSAVLVIQNGTTRLVNIKNQDTITKLLDMVPDVLDRFAAKGNGKMSEDDLNDILDEAEEEKK